MGSFVGIVTAICFGLLAWLLYLTATQHPENLHILFGM